MKDWQCLNEYSFIHKDGRTVRREYGKTPNGNDFGGRWVYRSPDGELIDFDKYWNDLFPRNGLVIDTLDESDLF